MATRTGTWSHVLKLCLDDFEIWLYKWVVDLIKK